MTVRPIFARDLTTCLLTGLMAVLALTASASGQRTTHVAIEDVTVCPARDGDIAPPDFTATACETVSLYDLDPQGRHLWVRLRLPLTDGEWEGTGPWGLMVMGKMSSEVFFNGTRIGTNGHPADTARAEEPGRIDASLFVPHTLVRAGDNTIDMRLSSHHGWLRLVSPIHAIQFSRYRDPTSFIITGYWG